ncbi:MAG: ROK family transcriptional regulator [Clostridia bacterium]|nr:ROK family transcriptional regulator [Clostridia bacterium]
MADRITPGRIKTNNRQQIYNYIYQKRRASQQDMLYALRLSRPTVATNLAELEGDGLICRSGQIEADQIGRKAAAYSIVPDYRAAVGVEILRAKVKIIAIDLYGDKLRREVVEQRFAHEPAYYKSVCAAINRFIDALEVPRDRILGVGISAQGLASEDGRSMVYGAILGCTGLTVDVFENEIGLPCRFFHDPQGAALSEIWVSPELKNGVYLSLSAHLGGAAIANRQIMSGKHGHNSTFEHIQVKPDGDVCYCGKRGCWDTLLSRRALVGDRTVEEFFEVMRMGDAEAVASWSAYLRNLGALIAHLHLVYDVDFILGGHLAPYFTEADIRRLYDEIRRLCPFDEADDFIRISKMPSHNITVGIALPYIRAYLDEIGVEEGGGDLA